MLQSNCRYFHCCDLFNKTFLLHWSKECIYFLEHVEASFSSSTRNGIPRPSCPPPASHAPCFMPWRQAAVVLEKEEWVWLDILCNFLLCKKYLKKNNSADNYKKKRTRLFFWWWFGCKVLLAPRCSFPLFLDSHNSFQFNCLYSQILDWIFT